MRIAGYLSCLTLCILSMVGCAAQQKLHGPWPKEIVTSGDWGEAEEAIDPLIPPYDPTTGAGTADQIKARFRGRDRKLAKTTITNAPMEGQVTVVHLIDSLVDDDDMRSLDPPIEKDSDSDRVDEERRSVKIEAWIYAIKYEEDQDWHLIVGTDPNDSPRTYFNCEVSGLPAKTAKDYQALLKARQSLASILHNDLPQPGGSYTTYPTPIPVLIEGSLFFDIDHAAGVVGPEGKRPKKAWEIHPITKIKLGSL